MQYPLGTSLLWTHVDTPRAYSTTQQALNPPQKKNLDNVHARPSAVAVVCICMRVWVWVCACACACACSCFCVCMRVRALRPPHRCAHSQIPHTAPPTPSSPVVGTHICTESGGGAKAARVGNGRISQKSPRNSFYSRKSL